MNQPIAPHTIHFDKIGHSAEGYLAIAEFEKKLPFVPLRAFWTYFTPHEVVRGRHAHYRTEMVILALNGRIELDSHVGRGTTFRIWLPLQEKKPRLLEAPPHN